MVVVVNIFHIDVEKRESENTEFGLSTNKWNFFFVAVTQLAPHSWCEAPELIRFW